MVICFAEPLTLSEMDCREFITRIAFLLALRLAT